MTDAKRGPGRPVTGPWHGDIEAIPDSMENIARAIMQGPPKENWRFEELFGLGSDGQAVAEKSGSAG